MVIVYKHFLPSFGNLNWLVHVVSKFFSNAPKTAQFIPATFLVQNSVSLVPSVISILSFKLAAELFFFMKINPWACVPDVRSPAKYLKYVYLCGANLDSDDILYE